ncbi:unnamed protein product, partial [Candidula unifasciata]
MTDRYPRLRSPSGRRYTPSDPSNGGVGGSREDNQNVVRTLPASTSQSKTGQMQSLLGEFKVLYESKLKNLDDADKRGEETTKVRTRVLQAYVNDLCEQNEVLVQTIDELEREANERVNELEDKLHKSSISGKDHQTKYRELERELRTLSVEKTRAEALLEDVQARLTQQEETTAKLREQNSNLNYDINQLISVMEMARSSGKWEVDRVRFRELTFDQVFGSLPKTSSSNIQVSDSDNDLRDQIRQKDDLIVALQQELKQLRSESRLMGGDTVSDTSELSATRLRSDLTKLQQRVEDLKYEIQSRDRKISSLTSHISDLETELDIKNSEINSCMQTVKKLQEKGRHSVLESSKSGDMIRQLKSDVVSLRENHSEPSQDISHFERHIRTLEAELAESKEYRRKNLDEIGILQEKLREGQFSIHDHHDVLKSELGRRDDTIQKLRKDVLSLQEKRDSALSELHRMEKRNKALEDETAHFRAQISEADDEVANANKKVTNLEGELQFLRSQNDECQGQICEQKEMITQLRNENRDIEDKLQEALSTAHQRNEVIKQMKEELKLDSSKIEDMKLKLEEADREHQHLQSRYTAQVKEIDRLQTETQEKELTLSQKETMYRSEMADREEEISRLKADLNVLHEKLAESEGQLISREEHIDHVQNKLRDVVSQLTRRENELQALESKLEAANDERKRLADVVQHREMSLQQLEHDFDHAKEKYKDAVEENGRLEARIQAFAISAQTEQDVLSSEMKHKDEGLVRMKMDIMKLQELCSRYEEQISQAEKEAEYLRSQLRSSQNE